MPLADEAIAQKRGFHGLLPTRAARSEPCQISVRNLSLAGKTLTRYSVSTQGDAKVGRATVRRSKPWEELSSSLHGAFRQRRCYASESYSETQLLRRRVIDGSVVEPLQGLFAPFSQWEGLSRLDQERFVIRGYAHACPDTVFCSLSAAVMHGLPVTYSLLGSLHLLASTPSERGGRGIEKCYRPSPALEKVDGVTVVSIVEATVECLRKCDFADGLALADGYLRKTHADASYLQSEVERLARRCRGVEMARDVACWADARAESGGESIARALMISLSRGTPIGWISYSSLSTARPFWGSSTGARNTKTIRCMLVC